jgi:hypothetical protein
MENMYRYEASARWVEKRRGLVEGEQLPQVAEFAAPPEFGGESGYWTPEHLLMG